MANEDPAYLDRVRHQQCCSPSGCRARRCEAHHSTGSGMGLRAHDHESMPLCARHHYDFHALSGPFKGWTKERLKQWQREQVAATRRRLEEIRDDEW